MAAGAAAAVLAYGFPDDAARFAEMADEAGQSRLLAGVQYSSDVTAGLNLGRAVAAQVIERAKTDGADARWTGSVPTEPGHWTGTNPVEPLTGTWKPWVLASGNQLRPSPPPAYDGPQMAMELAEVKGFNRTFDWQQKALYWQTLQGNFSFWYDTANQRIFEYRLADNAPRAARIYALMAVTHHDAGIACWDAKYAYWAIRPFQLDPEVKPLFPTPNHPSYPAAHGTYSGAFAATLAALFPREAAAINAKADEAALSRVAAGIHFRSDIEAGLTMGRAVSDLVIARAKGDGSQ